MTLSCELYSKTNIINIDRFVNETQIYYRLSFKSKQCTIIVNSTIIMNAHQFWMQSEFIIQSLPSIEFHKLY
jgi:hypothetical protein